MNGKTKTTRYNTPAPKWLRVLRDSYIMVGGAFLIYIKVFPCINEFTMDVIKSTYEFISTVLVGACIIAKGPKDE